MAASKGKWHATEEGEVCLVEITERSVRSVVLCRPGDQLGPQEKRDNARLIAAAPEMLAALEAIIAACNRDPHPCHYQIREAIDASRNAVLLAREGKDE